MPSQTFLNLDIEKKEKIIKAASSIFLEKTFEKAKVTDICKKAEIPRVTFYSYFESLEDIYNYVFECFSANFCTLDKIKSAVEYTEEYDDILKYFIKLLESEEGMKKIYKDMGSLNFSDKTLTHYIISLVFQFKVGAISKDEFIKQIGEAKANIQ